MNTNNCLCHSTVIFSKINYRISSTCLESPDTTPASTYMTNIVLYYLLLLLDGSKKITSKNHKSSN